EESFVPSPTTVLRRGDELLVVATDPVRDKAEARLRAVGEGGKLAGWLGTSGGSGVSGTPGNPGPPGIPKASGTGGSAV
ncbi:potassium/proton antiporter, partial [Streptomyces sp. SID8455]|nr:potassium/proton antiporter [Streptomyces sp. SID8455]